MKKNFIPAIIFYMTIATLCMFSHWSYCSANDWHNKSTWEKAMAHVEVIINDCKKLYYNLPYKGIQKHKKPTIALPENAQELTTEQAMELIVQLPPTQQQALFEKLSPQVHNEAHIQKINGQAAIAQLAQRVALVNENRTAEIWECAMKLNPSKQRCKQALKEAEEESKYTKKRALEILTALDEKYEVQFDEIQKEQNEENFAQCLRSVEAIEQQKKVQL